MIFSANIITLLSLLLFISLAPVLHGIDIQDYDEYDDNSEQAVDTAGADGVGADESGNEAEIPGGDGDRDHLLHKMQSLNKHVNRSVTSRTFITKGKQPVSSDLRDNTLNTTIKLEFLQKLLKNPNVIQFLAQLGHKVGNFSRNVKLNLRDFMAEAKDGLSVDSTIQMRNTLVAFIESLELSPLCLMSFVMMKRALERKDTWPIRFYDSMQIIPNGLLDGTFTSFGLYEECLDIENEQFPGLKMKGRYCLAKRELPFMYPSLNNETAYRSTHLPDNNDMRLLQAMNLLKKTYLRFGVCFPSTCSAKEINRALNRIMSPSGKQYVEIESECKVKDREIKLNGYQRTAQSIFVTLALLVAVSTGIELYYNLKKKSFGRKKVIKQSLLIFSAISNTKLLFSRDPKRLNTVSTILLAFISLELMGRSYVMPLFYNNIGLKRQNTGITKEFSTAKKFFWLRNSSYSMSIFILMSAIVLAYKICGDTRKAKYNPLHYIKYFINRYLSLFRRIIGPILLLYLIPLIGDGPIWHYYEPVHVQPCKQNLMASLLFYNNYMTSFDQICNLPSTTFSALFQLHLFAPLLLLLLNLKLAGYIILALLVVVGCLLSISRRFLLDFLIAPFEVARMESVPEITHSFIHYLGSTEQNISTFIVGLMWGYLIRKKPDAIKIGKNTLLCLWVFFLGLPQIASYWGERFKASEDFNQTSFVVWFLCGRVFWALGYGWIVFACSTNRGGIIQRVLTYQPIQPLARLAFGIYLLHIPVIAIRLFAIRDTYVMTHSGVFEGAIIDYVIAVVVAYVLYILIECPIYHLIKIICGQNVEKVVRNRGTYERTNGESVRDYEENIEIKLYNQGNQSTNDL